MHVLVELTICAAMTVALSVLHLLGLMWLIRLVQFHIEHWRFGAAPVDRVAVPLTMVTGLFLLHGTEIWAFAVLYRQLMGITFEHALYGSVTAYTTVDLASLKDFLDWRLVAGHEALVGMLLIGWSTAFLFQTLHRIMNTEENHPLPEGAIAVDEETETEEGQP